MLRDRVVGNYTFSQGADGHNISRRPSQHHPSFFPDGFDPVCVFIEGHHRRLLQNNTLASYIDKDAGCSQINSEICCIHLSIYSPSCLCNCSVPSRNSGPEQLPFLLFLAEAKTFHHTFYCHYTQLLFN